MTATAHQHCIRAEEKKSILLPACKRIAYVSNDGKHFNLHERNSVFTFCLFGVNCEVCAILTSSSLSA